MSTVSQPMYRWNPVAWRITERRVLKLQKRIYQASTRGDMNAVHQLQRLLMRSWWACLLAVRRVTQDNQGKKTAGVQCRVESTADSPPRCVVEIDHHVSAENQVEWSKLGG